MPMPPDFPERICNEGLDYLFFEPDDEDEVIPLGDRLSISQRDTQARRICAVCPHIVECALWGLEHEEYGVWGGLSEQDRAALGGKSAANAWRVDYAIKRMAKSLPETAVRSILRLWRSRQKLIEAAGPTEDEVA